MRDNPRSLGGSDIMVAATIASRAYTRKWSITAAMPRALE
jgi:hypothetical protein